MAALNWCIRSEKSGRLSPAGPEILAVFSHCLVKFQPILDCFIPNFKSKYEDSENMEADRCKYSCFQVISNKTSDIFGTPGSISQKDIVCINSEVFMLYKCIH